MTTEWAVMIAANVACAVVLWKKRERRLLWWNQQLSALASLAFVWLYFWDGCSRHAYELTTLLSDVLFTAMEAATALYLVWDEPTTWEFALAVTVAFHQVAKLQWHWAALPFGNVLGPLEYLNSLRAHLNYFVMALYVVVSYIGGDASASGEKNEYEGRASAQAHCASE